MSGEADPVELRAKIHRDNGGSVTLLVECNVSGRFRQSRIDADPDSCCEAEVPEIEPVSARWEELEDEHDETRNPAAGENDEFDLKSLSAGEYDQLTRELLEALVRWDEDRRYGEE